MRTQRFVEVPAPLEARVSDSVLSRLRDAWAKRKLLRGPAQADGALFDAKVSCVCGEVCTFAR